MRLSDLPSAIIDQIEKFRFDRIIEKHEGPEHWSSILKYYDPEFMIINGYDVLLPIEHENHRNITILRCIPSKDDKTLTIFLKDQTYVTDAQDEIFLAGRLAICEQVEGSAFYIAVVYHEWFIVSNESLG